MKLKISNKHLQIDRAQSTILAVIGVATFITIFSLISTKALLSQAAYQRRVLKARRDAITQINNNIKSANTLTNQYNNVFEGNDATNIIGGRNITGPNVKPPDGDNAKIVLDALPVTYDFPALLTTLSALSGNGKLSSANLNVADASATSSNKASADPQPVPITFSISGTGTYESIQSFVKDIEHSIRPIDVTNVSLSGPESDMQVNFQLTTYYQPAKSLDISNKVVK